MKIGNQTFGIGLHHSSLYFYPNKVYESSYKFYRDTPVKDGILLFPADDPSLKYADILNPYKKAFSSTDIDKKRNLSSVFPDNTYAKRMLLKYKTFVITGGDARGCMANMLEEIIENTMRDIFIHLICDSIYEGTHALQDILAENSAFEMLFNKGKHYGGFKKLKIRTPINIYEKGAKTHIKGEGNRAAASVYITDSSDFLQLFK